jgi:hypothetical protein
MSPQKAFLIHDVLAASKPPEIKSENPRNVALVTIGAAALSILVLPRSRASSRQPKSYTVAYIHAG